MAYYSEPKPYYRRLSDITSTGYDPKADVKQDNYDRVAAKFRRLVNREGRSIRSMFERFDRNGDGRITALELWRGSKDLGLDMDDQELNALVWRFDIDGDGQISFLEFETFMEEREMKSSELEDVLDNLKRMCRNSHSEVNRIFEQFDRDWSGEIDVKEFHQGLRDLKIAVTVHEAQLIMDKFPCRTVGRIKYREFCRFLLDAYVPPRSDKMYSYSHYDLDPRLVTKVRNAILGSAHSSNVGQLFRQFDRDGNGVITNSEFREGLRQLGIYNIDRSDIMDIIDRFDYNGDGYFSYNEFVDFMSGVGSRDTRGRAAAYDDDFKSEPPRYQDRRRGTVLSKISQVRDEMERIALVKKGTKTKLDFNAVFDEIDTNGDGEIDRREFRRALIQLNLHLSDTEVDWIYDEFGDPRSNRDVMPYRKFVDFMSNAR